MAQQKPQPSEQEAEVVSRGSEHGIGAIAVAALEIVAIPPMVTFDVADGGLDRGSSLHLAAYRGGDASHLAGDPDLELVGMAVAAIALVDVDAGDLDPRELSVSATTGPSV